MWAHGADGVLALSAQRLNLLWYVKAGIAIYALAVIGSRIYLRDRPSDPRAVGGPDRLEEAPRRSSPARAAM